jgi:hypothetical protein
MTDNNNQVAIALPVDKFAKLRELAAGLPDAYRDNANALIERMASVIEGVGDRDITWRPPLLKLVQSTTDRSSLPKGVGIGDFVLGEEKQEQPLTFFPFRLFDNRQYWDPDPAVTKMICNSPDAKLGFIGKECKSCHHSEWDEANNRSDCSRVKVVLAIKSDLSELFQINFQKTSYQSGMALQSLTKTHPKQKNVEIYDVAGLTGDARKAPAEIVPFLQELFNMISVDRKEHLDVFYKMVEDRRAKGQLPTIAHNSAPKIENGGADETLALPTDVTDVTETVSPLAKNYQV